MGYVTQPVMHPQLQQQQQQQQQQQTFYQNSGSLPINVQQDIYRRWMQQFGNLELTKSFKSHELPLARIKKIMKSDEDVKMISAEAPILFAKACEMFIVELTLRAWVHTEESKRRTLQRNDIATAISKTDIFDFLIDIVPREDGKPPKKDLSRPQSIITPEQYQQQQQQYMFMLQQHAFQQQAVAAAAAAQQAHAQQSGGQSQGEVQGDEGVNQDQSVTSVEQVSQADAAAHGQMDPSAYYAMHMHSGLGLHQLMLQQQQHQAMLQQQQQSQMQDHSGGSEAQDVAAQQAIYQQMIQQQHQQYTQYHHHHHHAQYAAAAAAAQAQQDAAQQQGQQYADDDGEDDEDDE